MEKITLKQIWEFIKGKVFIALIIIALIIMNAMQCSRIKELKRQQEISDQNNIALNDSIKYEKQKNGDLQASIAIYIASEKELKDLNRNLYNKIKEQDGRIISLGEAIIQLKQDSATLARYLVEKEKLIKDLKKIDENTYAAPWQLTYRYDSTNFDIFTGRTYIGVSLKDSLRLFHLDTELIKRLTQIDLTWGQKVEKGQYRVFLQSGYPGFTAAQLQGVLIDPNTNPDIRRLIKEKKWFNGFNVGIGVTGGFNITTGKYGLVVGPTISYSIYNF